MNTEYDTRPEIMRLLKLFGKFTLYWDRETNQPESCTYWRGYMHRHRDDQLLKNVEFHDRITGEGWSKELGYY